ncbi:ABC transporter permease [Pseudovibrio exalbescens]|uniref:ABC transporter permease n=1 Tax=Pseudovibrio exalbescens TaxID=197461 RepID=UPI000C9C412D|nr:ABC transporter permease subunit [Pseudovibrio exalbescens]
MRTAFAFAGNEFRISRRNRLLWASVLMMVLFSGALTLLSSGSAGNLGVDTLTAASASLATLSVYLVPLIALILSFDAIAGELERGTLALILTYPAPRFSLIFGKFLAHGATLAIALCLGYGVAAGVSLAVGSASIESAMYLLRLLGGALLLGASFLGLGYALSAWTRSTGAAAGYAIGAWLFVVVLYDVALLAGLVVDTSGGPFSKIYFPWLLIANPADAFRLVTLPSGQAAELSSGFISSAAAMSAGPLVSLLAWPVAMLVLAWMSIRRISP